MKIHEMAFASVATSPCLADLPAEIFLDILHHLELGSIFNLALANNSFFRFFQQRKASILLPVLTEEFAPFDELLQVYTATSDDLDADGGLYRPRRVIFRRFPGDCGQVLAPRSMDPSSMGSAVVIHSFTKVLKSWRLAETGLKTVVLSDVDVDPILDLCCLVRDWEGLFPQMRWVHEPENCRSLRPQERIRYRRAFYRWWLYGIYFHGELPRPRIGLPEPYVDDIRTSQMRYYSTSDLLELMDLTETMKDVVLHYICPRLESSQRNVSRWSTAATWKFR